MTDLEDRLRALSPVVRQALEHYRTRATELGGDTVETESADGTVRVTATLHGRIVDVRLVPHSTTRIDRFTLAELVADTCREAQRQARSRYHEELAAILPPEYTEYQRLMESVVRA
ncbi:YbaB/EbfC family nucleoid-associated protein [Actinocatenispora rupis]|uniref:YbaB/EbfC DNA-binding family protein n=1 Tax=Actinocatenispora rupis TaxID=519421 RepID=A0A8J3JDV9_9ACTN|nr:YbaB/EbfC family nucleoid-associated protein [Actinocatenispora rupis]GID14682.1 hypothetical protein Aru02nite_55710 [Actinocatenispora rupis]